MEARIGISGWRYEPWRQSFYPPKMPHRQELAFASRMVNSIELNGTFYSLQRPESFKTWYNSTPDDFQFSIKGPRYITHIKRLRNAEAALGNFLGSGVFHLREKLGPFLWQLPPNFLFRDDVLEDFFEILPRSWKDARKAAKKADRLEPDFPPKVHDGHIRHAIEVRHDSFINPDFIDLLRKHDIALVFADTAGRFPFMEDLTSDFVYLRLHGEEELYASGYPESSLDFWSERIKIWQRGGQPSQAFTISDDPPPKYKTRDVYVYFDNDVKAYAPFNAQGLLERTTKHHSPDPADWKNWLR
jgi:uncharacterized protein YecE (DUF72 family)